MGTAPGGVGTGWGKWQVAGPPAGGPTPSPPAPQPPVAGALAAGPTASAKGHHRPHVGRCCPHPKHPKRAGTAGGRANGVPAEPTSCSPAAALSPGDQQLFLSPRHRAAPPLPLQQGRDLFFLFLIHKSCCVIPGRLASLCDRQLNCLKFRGEVENPAKLSAAACPASPSGLLETSGSSSEWPAEAGRRRRPPCARRGLAAAAAWPEPCPAPCHTVPAAPPHGPRSPVPPSSAAASAPPATPPAAGAPTRGLSPPSAFRQAANFHVNLEEKASNSHRPDAAQADGGSGPGKLARAPWHAGPRDAEGESHPQRASRTGDRAGSPAASLCPGLPSPLRGLQRERRRVPAVPKHWRHRLPRGRAECPLAFRARPPGGSGHASEKNVPVSGLLSISGAGMDGRAVSSDAGADGSVSVCAEASRRP